ncbi:hypothetical protein EDB89DRAFT_1379539, partial [Lactarius sanguifluus]
KLISSAFGDSWHGTQKFISSLRDGAKGLLTSEGTENGVWHHWQVVKKKKLDTSIVAGKVTPTPTSRCSKTASLLFTNRFNPYRPVIHWLARHRHFRVFVVGSAPRLGTSKGANSESFLPLLPTDLVFVCSYVRPVSVPRCELGKTKQTSLTDFAFFLPSWTAVPERKASVPLDPGRLLGPLGADALPPFLFWAYRFREIRAGPCQPASSKPPKRFILFPHGANM